ncbi:hypothetical protein BPOR_0671g00020 [Botrytis porri]|uniref:Uncharacterized protein n=1 Tax=Botrytis porri TaxID=87229 RepID=A0A4Z1KGE2_9HELO|nr:hypothetical protein BPOR_0671g00020 [Botrytis porri]
MTLRYESVIGTLLAYEDEAIIMFCSRRVKDCAPQVVYRKGEKAQALGNWDVDETPDNGSLHSGAKIRQEGQEGYQTSI